MVIVLERTIREDDKRHIRDFLTGRGFRVREIVGEEETIFGAVGTAVVDLREVEVLPGVVRVIPISKPYKLASRELQKQDTVMRIGPIKIGGPRVTIASGPCAVESREQIMETAAIVRESGAVILRGGAYKPRTSPYSFQGLGEAGLKLLKEAGEANGMPVISEIVAVSHVPAFREHVDILQIGARNMQNFELLKAVGSARVPVMLKRGLAATIEEWLMAAEYLLAHGAEDVILCERGIRTFETYTRNTLDISSIPVVKKLSHLPVFVDPSHATGIRAKVPPLGLAAVAAGADGLIVEVHPRPDEALSDGPQSLYPEQLEKLMRDIEVLAPVVGKELTRLPIAVRPSAAGRGRAGDATDAATPTDAGIAVAFQGERGAYSEMALSRYFQNEDVVPVPCARFSDVFDAVLSARCRSGIVPIENSLAGSVHENYDLLLQYPDLRIVGELKLRVEHSLLGCEGATEETIRSVYSHPQALAQCDAFLARHEQWQRIPFYDTAGSAAHVAEEGRTDAAAIANARAAETYGLQVIREGIETNPHNYTRFVVLARESETEVEHPDMASIVFSTPDRPGALYGAMEVLARAELNLKKLESRPIPGKPWQYMFYLDVELPPEFDRYQRAMGDLVSHVEDLRVLGTYRSH